MSPSLLLRSFRCARLWGAALALISATAAADSAGTAHPAGIPCTGCHLSDPSGARAAGPLVASQERLCGDCHRGAVQMSHPSGFRPTRSVNATLPLDEQGRLTCSTCHEVHGRQPGLLRGTARGRGFCASCHDAGFFAAMKDGGQSLTVSAHIDARTAFSRIGIDGYSARCLTCHGERGQQWSARGGLRHGGASSNHPIGMDYRSAQPQSTYRAAALLPREVFLPDGKVGCVSCHAGYSREHGRLVLTLDKSRLCMSCHAL